MYRFYVRGGGGVGVSAGAVHFPRAFAKHEQFAGLVAEIGQGDSFFQRPLALKTLFEGFVGGQSFPFTDVAVQNRNEEGKRERWTGRERKRTGRRERQTNMSLTLQQHQRYNTTTNKPPPTTTITTTTTNQPALTRHNHLCILSNNSEPCYCWEVGSTGTTTATRVPTKFHGLPPTPVQQQQEEEEKN